MDGYCAGHHALDCFCGSHKLREPLQGAPTIVSIYLVE